MARNFKHCIAEIRKAAGVELSEAELERLLSQVADRARRRARETGRTDGDVMVEAAQELSAEVKAAAAIAKRSEIQNLKKRIGRREFYETAPDLVMGMEAKLVGVNTPFAGSRLSVEARGRALRRDYLVGLATDLDRLGLFETVRGGDLDRDWARELFELSRTENGRPGVTGSKDALAVAEIIHRYQRLSVDNLNRAGAWIGHYDGYISRTAHDADLVRKAGFDTWRNTIEPLLDERTFDGIEDRSKFLQGVYDGLRTGIHLTQDGLQGFKDPAFKGRSGKGMANLAKKLSQGRVLHFKHADAWLDYHQAFGGKTLIESVLRSLESSARSTALMREFGTNPRAEFEADLQALTEKHRGSAAGDALQNAETMLGNRFNQVDGTAQMPVNRHMARIGGGTRAVQSMAKLGGIVMSAITDVPLKAAEFRYQGGNLLEAYADGVTSLARGRGAAGSETREIMDLLRAGAEGMVGDIAARFDGADTVPGTMSKAQNVFFRWTGITYWTDAQRGGAEMLMARRLGTLQQTHWRELPEETRRLLTMYDVREADWHRLQQVESTKDASGRGYLTPDMAERIPHVGGEYARELALKVHALYADRGEFAVLQPGARERAILQQGTRPGTKEGEALRLLMQFKAFPVAVISKAWGREIYGGQGGFGAVAGLTHMMVAATVFGYVAMAAKDLAKGRNPRDPADPKTWAAAFVQGGGAGLYGDFFFGEFSRFGRSLLASLTGPTFGQVDDVIELWHRARSVATGDGKGGDALAQALRLAVNNTPFVNLVWTRMGMDLFFFNQVQEALNPGSLRRVERRVERETGATFWLRPSEVIPHGAGGLPRALVPGSSALNSGGGGASAAPPSLR